MSHSEFQVSMPAGSGAQAPVFPNGASSQFDGCWNTIGVLGNGTCGELQKFVRCANCPVYSKAAALLLDQPLPAEYRRERTDYFAREKKLAVAPNLSGVLFRVHCDWLALPTAAFQEVTEGRVIHSLPHRRQRLVLGLANIRGELLIAVSLGRLFGLDAGASGHELPAPCPRLLVVSWDRTRFVFPVEEVRGLHRFHSQELQEPPITVAKAIPSFTQGVFWWQERTVGFLDPERLFAALNRNLT